LNGEEEVAQPPIIDGCLYFLDNISLSNGALLNLKTLSVDKSGKTSVS
jgi:hypothetical protein